MLLERSISGLTSSVFAFTLKKKILSIRCTYLGFLHPLEARRWGCAYILFSVQFASCGYEYMAVLLLKGRF